MDDCFAATWAYSHGPLVDPVSRLHHQHTSSTPSTPHQHHNQQQQQLHEQQQQQLSNESILDIHEHTLIGYTSANSSSTINLNGTAHQYQQQQQSQHYDNENILPLSPAVVRAHNISHINYVSGPIDNYGSPVVQSNGQSTLHHDACNSILDSYVSSINNGQQVQERDYGATGNGINYDCQSQVSSTVFAQQENNNGDPLSATKHPADDDDLLDAEHLQFPHFFTQPEQEQIHVDGGDTLDAAMKHDLDEIEQGDLTDLSGNFDINHPSVSTTDYLIDEDYEEDVEDEEEETGEELLDEQNGDGNEIAIDLLKFKKRGKSFNVDGGGLSKKQGELKCRFCGFVCCSKSSLGIHERRHTGEKPYSCKYCGRLFNSAQCCKHHMRLHTNEKPFECAYCGKKYAVSTRLKRHERVHTREEPYKCQECGKTFRWFDAFRDHRNTHNGVALYLCSVCGKSFTSYLKFYYHERGHFQKKEKERNVRALMDTGVTAGVTGKKGKISGTTPKKIVSKKAPKNC